MATKKKSVKKKKTSKKSSSKKSSNSSTSSNTEKVLVENFVSLQKVMVNMSSKFDELTKQISKLLGLFEESAKALSEKDFGKEKENKDTKEILEKMDSMAEQNKTIARGLTLMHDKIQQNPSPKPLQSPQKNSEPPHHMPKPVPKQVMEQGSRHGKEYQRSISSKKPF